MAYDDIIASAAKQYALDPSIIKGVIKIESSWNPSAYRAEPQINDASYGLMQVLLGTARRVANNANITTAQLLQPALNVMIGAKYLRDLLNEHGSLPEALAAYNAGKPYRVQGDPTKYTNQAYVDKALKAIASYRAGLTDIAPAVIALGAVAVGVMMLGGRGRG